VVLPTHRRPHRLSGALASVLAQTYSHLEVLVVDDASPTPALKTVRDLCGEDGRVQVIRLETNRGAAAARNAGLLRANGELVAFLDDDDRWEPQKVATQVEHLLANPDVGIVSCNYLIDHERSGVPPLTFRGPTTFTAEQVQWSNFPGSFSFVMARRNALGEELWLDELFPSVEDWDLWLRCSRRARPDVVNQVLVRQVFHDERRLSNPQSEWRGLELFLDKHASTLPKACRGFIAAHIRMQRGEGWAKRGGVLRSLLSPSARLSAILTMEQVTRQLGRARRDPGLVSRALARMIGPDGTGTGARRQQATPS
jgi:glycosyltransferase involved in cell wall biosynthesis